ncbi:hypothetical protein, partial [Dysosmobacter sp.]|uniref:hypothetical protein n=1 Tax=Dysosmobacter sp. TaxID=2591382 RepID=UPI003AF71800
MCDRSKSNTCSVITPLALDHGRFGRVLTEHACPLADSLQDRHTDVPFSVSLFSQRKSDARL